MEATLGAEGGPLTMGGASGRGIRTLLPTSCQLPKPGAVPGPPAPSAPRPAVGCWPWLGCGLSKGCWGGLVGPQQSVQIILDSRTFGGTPASP